MKQKFLITTLLALGLAGCSSSKPESEILQELNCAPRDVRNDTTGNWKVCTVTTTMSPEEYAVDYYNGYLKDNPEQIHGIVNFTNNTTTKISMLGNLIDVTTYEYVEDEEHDANALYGGQLLTEETIDPETKEVEKLQ